MIRDPAELRLPPRQQALSGLASLLTEAPWTVDDGDFERLRAAGLDDEAIVQAVTIAGFFNHVTRMADATGLEFDYESALPRMQVDPSREPIPRPAREDWPGAPASPRLPLSLRPGSEAAIARWREFAYAGDDSLSARERALVAGTAAYWLCDAKGAALLDAARPATPRDLALAAYAEKLTVTPWRMTEADLAPLRREGLDDRGLVRLIGLIGFQNLESRVRLALG